MRKQILLLFLTLLMVSCEKEDATQELNPFTSSNIRKTQYPDDLSITDVEEYARSIMKVAGWEWESRTPHNNREAISSGSWLASNHQSVLDQENDIMHHVFEIRVGRSKYDRIRLHRVVKMQSRNFPQKTNKTAFLLHGDFKDFEGVFLPGVKSPRIDDHIGLAAFLARNGVDVWGIDQAWTLVPEEETDFSFMKDWGMARQVHDLKKAMTLARIIRFLSGNGLKPLHLLGYSSGSTVGFALLNDESSQPLNNRNVAGYIGVDQGVATDNSTWEAIMCETVAGYQALIDAGQYQDFNPLPFFGRAAVSDPEGASELIPGFTNLQAALALGVYPLFEPYPGHFFAGIFDSDFLPTGMQYTDLEDWLDFLTYAPPYEPVAFERDEYITSCPAAGEVPWDDHLDLVTNPVLYVSAGGGFGGSGLHTLSLLGSSDITKLQVSFHPESEVLLDYGHIDLFLASNAEAEVWQPILDWLVAH